MLPLGSILDRKYDLQEKIGEGAMGTVYRATHVVTQQELAVKVLSARRASETAKARFLREVRLAGALRHPNVVRVVDAGEDHDSETLYIVMEHLVGRDLEAVFDRGELSRAEAFEHLLQVLPALAQAHDAGIVHRDLKPENLFLCDDGTVKLLDFGVARDLGGAKVTATGTAMGTPVYMSPEQALRPKEIDHRSDLWSVGVMLYEIVASFPPFVDESPHAVVFKANTEAHAPLGEVVLDTPPELVALVDRCLAKTKEGRPTDARAIATVLREVLADERAATFLAAPVAFGTAEVDPSTAPVPRHSSPTAAALGTGEVGSATAHGPSAETGGRPLGMPVGGRSRAWAGLVVLAAVALLGWLGWSISQPGEDPPAPVAAPSEASEPTRADAPRADSPESEPPAPEPVPIEPVVAEPEPAPDPEPEPEREPAPRLARRSPPPPRPEPSEPVAVMAPAPAPPPPEAEPEPAPEPEPAAEPEPAPEPSTRVERERRSPTTERPSRRPRRRPQPAAEPEPPPLTF